MFSKTRGRPASKTGIRFRFSGRNLFCLRGGQVVFRHVTFSVSAGGALLLSGINGSGKTSLLRMMAGFLPPFSGELFLNGGALRSKRRSALVEQCAWLGLASGMRPELSLYDNVAFWARLSGEEKALPRVLERCGLLQLAGAMTASLSYGQKQRMSLARLLLQPAALLWLLDEPDRGLDGRARSLLKTLIAEHRDKGGAVVMASHHLSYLPRARVLDLSLPRYHHPGDACFS